MTSYRGHPQNAAPAARPVGAAFNVYTRRPQADASPTIPGQGARAVLSLVIFVHLFLVAVAFTSYSSASALQQRLLQVFGPYLKTFNFDVNRAYGAAGRYHLTHALLTDIDYTLEVDAKVDGRIEQVRIPPADVWPRQRLQRYQALANATGWLAEDPVLQSILPRAIAAGVLNSLGAQQGTVRCRAHFLTSLENMKSATPAQRDPYSPTYYTNVYEADVLVSDGSVDLLKRSAAAETAPVQQGNKRP